MPSKLKRLGKEIVKQFAISFFFCSLIFVIMYFLFSDEITRYVSLVNLITINEQDNVTEPAKFDSVRKKIINYPFYKEKWARLKIASINLDLPIYHGDTLEVLKYGVGHFMGSYFPGEGGSIIMPAHNTASFFRRLPELTVGQEIIIEATYGTFTYEITSTDIINYQDPSKLPIQKEKELLMLYTCYPVNTVGLKTKRFVVYAELVGESYAS